MKDSALETGMSVRVLVTIQISRGLNMRANGVMESDGGVVFSMIEMGVLYMMENGWMVIA